MSAGQFPPTDSSPVEAATYQLALDIQRELEGNLGVSLDGDNDTFDARFEQRREAYPYLLFGELAMHLAEVRLPKGATVPDRARGIIEALQRIATTPSLLEAITNNAYTSELATTIGSNGEITLPERQVNESSVALQQEVAKKGYFDRAMAQDKQVILLEYTTSETIKTKRFRGQEIPAQTPILLKVIPSFLSWTIKRYECRNSEGEYKDYIDERKASYKDTFKLVAIESEAQVPKFLIKLIGQDIGIGQVSRGSQLKVTYNYGHYRQEVPGYEMSRFSSTRSLPANLRQVYAGDSTEYPLFPRY